MINHVNASDSTVSRPKARIAHPKLIRGTQLRGAMRIKLTSATATVAPRARPKVTLGIIAQRLPS